MATEAKEPHIMFFPLMSPGHFIPMIDMACIFASHNVRATVVTTPSNVSKIPITKSKTISIVTIPFPSSDLTNLPHNHEENLATIPTAKFGSFVFSLYLLEDPLSQLITDLKPDCLISDSIFYWTTDLALRLNIPRIVFHGPFVFPMYVAMKILSFFPLDESKEEFLIDGLGEKKKKKIKVYKNGLFDTFQSVPLLTALVEAEAKSYGVVVNTFQEMEPAYVDFYKGLKRAWCVGPVSLGEEKAEGWTTESRVAKDEIVNWLDGKEEGSVVYVCFGTLYRLSGGQLRELALGLERSGINFLWVVRKNPERDDVTKTKDWMPEDYTTRIGGRGLVVQGWAPQNTILHHKSIGWFITHCGSTSVMESTCAGVPMITWPLFNEQFINAEFIVETMGIGERMWEGFRRSEFKEDDDVVVTADEVAEVVKRAMEGGEKYEVMKKKAKDYKEKAKKAVEEGESSFNDIVSLIEDLKTL